MPASTLAMKSDFHLFKKGVKPEWEDKANREGGKWSYSFRGKPQINIDDLWLHTCLAAIGETLEPVPAAGGGSGSGKAAQKQESEIMGVVVNVRKGFYRVGLWTKSKDKKMEEQLVAIGRRFKEVLRLPATETVEFQAHDDSEKSGTSRAKNRYYA